jgi:hypothetical protein
MGKGKYSRIITGNTMVADLLNGFLYKQKLKGKRPLTGLTGRVNQTVV